MRRLSLLIILAAVMLKVPLADERPWNGLTRIEWIPGPSDIYLSNDNGTNEEIGGISPLYSPVMSIRNETTRAIGNIPDRDISGERLTLSSSLGFSGVTAGKKYRYYDSRNAIRYETLNPDPVQLGGYYLVILYPFSKAITLKPYFSTTEGNGLYYRVDDDTVAFLQSAIRTQSQFSTAGFNIIPVSQVKVRVGAVEKNEYAGLRAAEYLKTYGDMLTQCGVRYESIFFVQGETSVSSGAPGAGNYHPAILVSYGTKSWAYAMYGVWHDDAKAREYGFRKDQRVYFTEKTMLPDNETYQKYPDIAVLQIQPEMRYGKMVVSEEEILADKERYFPLLAWRPFKAWSEMHKEFAQPDSAYVLKIENTDEFPPNAPDNTDNTNGPGMTDCADMEWYWDLYCQCIEEKLVGSQETADSKKYQDYKDYLGVQAMQQQYDPTVYGMDRSTSPQMIGTDNQPAEPAIYNKECQLLNGKEVEIYDPFAPDAEFYLYQRYWDWSIGHTGFFKRERDVSSKFQKSLNELRSVYDYFITNNGRETLWGYIRNGNSFIKKWPHGGDVEVSITRPELLDSAWFVANPFANYRPFETYRQFAVYDNWAAQGRGPFRMITRENDTRDNSKKDQPDYQRYKNPWIGGDIPSEQAWEKKDWYVQWKYDLVYKDKYDRKFSIGTLTFTSALWKGEDDKVMPSNFEWNGGKVNGKMNIGGKTPFNDPATGYSKNSKDYRTDQTDPGDRSPDAEIDKGEAMWEIARKIAVSELFNLATKTVHKISERNDQAGYAATVAYEASKRLENYVVLRKTFELAKDMYKGYVFWRETMDIIADCRDTYNSISAAWDGLRTSALNLFDYYKNLDFRKVRLTNITKLLPGSYLYDIDISLYCLQSSLASFNASLDALAFQSDRLTRGNYGPFNPVILYATAELMQATAQSGEATTRFLENSVSALNQVTQGASNSTANKAYLSNITKATHNAITNQRLMVMNEKNRSAAVGLFILQQEANDWVTYNNHMRYAAGNMVDWTREATRNNFYPIIAGFQSPPGIFKDQGYWEALANAEGEQSQ